ncbi:MAG: type II toxin-antitoxin system PemK/MazF family toxin [Chthoniobacterales bacterium]|jgi:mRNA interferase MazF
MVSPTAGSVVLVPFPFSDLSHSKRRPAVVLANSGKGDWILCQLTSRSYADERAVELTDRDFLSGGLRVTSYARPGKLFTAHEGLFISEEGILMPVVLQRITDRICSMLDPRK